MNTFCSIASRPFATLSGWVCVRLDSVLRPSRNSVSPIWLLGRDVFHYSIPVIEETGDGRIESGSEIESGKLLLRGGEVLVSRLNPRKGRVLLASPSKYPIVASGEFIALEPRGCDARFGKYLLSSGGVRQYLSSAVQSVTRSHQRVDPSVLTKAWVALPDIDRQRAIADYLDRETTRIDQVIAKHQQLSHLVLEERDARIAELVSGSGWKRMSLKHCFKGTLVNGVFKRSEQFGSGTRLVNVLDAYRADFVVDEGSLDRVEVNSSELRRYALQPDDILFVRSSLKREGIARAVLVQSTSQTTVFECHLVRGRTNATVADAEFLVYLLNSIPVRDALIARSNTTTMTTISQGLLSSLPVALPVVSEQKRLATRIRELLIRNERLQRQIEEHTLQTMEYRSAIISSAVTGGVDMGELRTREAAATCL